MKTVEWGETNHVAFDNSKDEMIAYKRRWRSNLKRRIVEARIKVREYIMSFNTKAT